MASLKSRWPKAALAGLAGLAGLGLLAGCATVDPRADWERVGQKAALPEAPQLVWAQSQADEERVAQGVRELLAGGLDQDKAVRVALLNNRALQAAFEEIGVSRADLVQAGLFSNPSLEALLRWPIRGDDSGMNVEISGSVKVSDLWQLPLRRKVAEAAMERTILEVGEAVLATRREAKTAYARAYFLEMMRRQAAELVELAEALERASLRRREFGYLGDPAVYQAQEQVWQARLEASEIEMERNQARAALVRVLGLIDGEPPRLAAAPPEPTGGLPDLERALALAQAGRLDVQVARLKMVEAQRRARLERARVVKDVHLGADWERESGGGQLLGPKLGIELPVFDQNQAGIARAEHQARQWAKQVQALEGRLREEVGADLERVRFLRLKQDYLDNRMGPLRQEALAYARKWAGLMQLDQVSLLQAQRDLARTPLMSLRNRLELHQALAGLEYHLGGRLP